MAWNELAEVLLALVESVQAPAETGLVVTEADLDIPLEVTSAMRNGELVFFGSAPHTRWKSGMLPPVHLGRLHVELLDEPRRT